MGTSVYIQVLKMKISIQKLQNCPFILGASSANFNDHEHKYTNATIIFQCY